MPNLHLLWRLYKQQKTVVTKQEGGGKGRICICFGVFTSTAKSSSKKSSGKYIYIYSTAFPSIFLSRICICFGVSEAFPRDLRAGSPLVHA